MVHAKDVISIYQSLAANCIQAWLMGGWGIDALLQEQTRTHKDLDVLMLLDDIAPMSELLGHNGYFFKGLWPENSWSVNSRGVEAPTAFILQDPCLPQHGNLVVSQM